MDGRLKVELVYDDNAILIKKSCSKCGRLLDIEHFNKEKRKSTGYQSYCRECQRMGRRRLRRDKKEGNYEPKYSTGDDKRRFDSNCNITHKRCSHCKKMLPIEMFRKQSTSTDGHKQICKKCISEYNRSPEGSDRFRRGRHKRRILKKGNGGSWEPEQWKECLQFFDYKDAYTGLSMNTISLDHIIPVSKGGTSFIHNIIPCENNINKSKNNSDVFEWYSKQPYFSWDRYLKICMWIIKNGGTTK